MASTGKLVVKEVFQKLVYGPCPESDSGVRAWVAAHNNGHFGLFINNKWEYPEGRTYLDSISPADKKKIAATINGTAEDINTAVAAAKAAAVSWSALPGYERAKYLYSIARHVQKHSRLLAVLEALDNGKPFRETKNADIPLVARHFYHHAGWAQLMEEEFPDYKPVGVVGAIVPWNFPLMLLAWKVAPALAMGNTVVLKPASYTRLSALLFAEICAEAGLPPGVLNVVTGSGAIGSTLADHPDVDKIAFTGSTPIGRVLRQRIAGSGKKISLELGGKSAAIIYGNADLDSAVEGLVDGIFFNQGQVCCASSRALVQECVYERFVKKLKARLNVWKIGHSLEKDIDMGALVDESQYKTIKSYCERAEAEGCEVYKAPVPVPENGYFWPPTVITNVQQNSTVVREEIFGPVVTVQSFRTMEEAVALENNSIYGLGGSVWSENISQAVETATKMKAGAIWINCHNVFDAAAPFGGYKESGFGRDGAREGLYEYIKPKWQVREATTDAPVSYPFTKDQVKWPSPRLGLPAPIPSLPGVSQDPIFGLKIDRTRKVYIGGQQKRPDGEYTYPVFSPSGKYIGDVADSNRKDLRDAVEAAHSAAPGWGKRAAHNRAQILYYIAENLMARTDDFVKLIMDQTGASEEDAKKEVAVSIQRLFYYAAYADKYGGDVKETTFYGLTCTLNEPVGVIGLVCPDEFPLLGFISLIAPTIVRGNTVVVIPSQKSPLCATELYQVFDTSDLPGGVVNILTGEKDVLTKTLVEHKDVQGIWYFGSKQMCANVEFVASDNMKRTWVNYGQEWDWLSKEQGQGEEFLRHATEVKCVWVPMGDGQP